ncbi:winged helix-turn-helix domain-containing protein [Candidatus Bipolaricaulota bacterium]|nr:winged helix-turn-helix domain-containing protein [Candidatus Bipolaricaulota bacterium]
MDVNEALQALEDAVRSTLEAAKVHGARAFETGQFELAKRAADDGKTIEAFVEEVARIKRRWENLQNVSQESTRSLDAPVHVRSQNHSGDPINPEVLIQSILRVLEDMGGTAQRDDVIERLEQTLTEAQKTSNGESAAAGLPVGWGEMLMAAQKMMVKRGLLHARPQRGIWQITPQGRLLLFEKQ